MNQTVNTINDIGKSTESGQADNLNRHNAVNRIIVLKFNPWIVCFFLIAERNFLVFFIDCFHVNFNFIADIHNILRVLNTVPGKFGDVNHTVYTADIDKRTVAGQRFHLTGVNLTFLNACPKCFTCSFSLFAQHASDGADCSAALRVHIDDSELHGLPFQSSNIFTLRHTGKRCGDKYFHSICGNENAAANHIGHCAFHDLAAFFRLSNVKPTFAGIKELLGKLHSSLCIVCFHDDEIELIANLDKVFDLGRRIVSQIFEFNYACLFSAGINKNFAGSNLDYCTNYMAVSCVFIFNRLCKQLLEAHLLIINFFVFLNNFRHGFKYLLNNTVGSGSSCGDTYTLAIGKIDLFDFICLFNQIRFAVFLTNMIQLACVRTCPPADDNHHVNLRG